jgi:hypothetical protein
MNSLDDNQPSGSRVLAGNGTQNPGETPLADYAPTSAANVARCPAGGRRYGRAASRS